MSRYNTAGRCGACERAARDTLTAEPTPPGPDLQAPDDALIVRRNEQYHGPHVRLAAEDAEPIEWRRFHPPLERARVIEHTCECDAVMYELCSTGGRFHIRKTTRGRGGVRAEESPHLVRQKTAQLWEQLQRGRAR